MKELDNNISDFIVKAIKGATGTIPIAGSAIGEALELFIPNQRLDRIVKFISRLNERLSILEDAQIRERLSIPERNELLAEGIRYASHAIRDERMTYLVNLVSQSITKDKIEFEEEKHFMRMLNELNDIEILVLRSYWFSGYGGTQSEDHNEHVYKMPSISKESTEEEIEIGAIQMSYRLHLSSLGLLWQTNVISQHGNRPLPPERGQYKITSLGKLLLKRIGLSDIP